ncbi:protein disulfide oxidoreductase [Enterovibrio sp. 27052020O]|uniref:protein disulfide oxidoreductase n=1 Tax=Enterovibrio sp. 27052020O TaxID=3241166 RepID=UPI00388DBE34
MNDPSQSPLPDDPQTPDPISTTRSKWRNPVWWLKEIATIVVLFSVITLALDWWQSRDMPNGNVPQTILTTLSGDTIDLATASKNEPVVLYFWATWCPACKFVTPTVDWLSGSYKVVSIAMTSGNRDRVAGYLRSHDISFETVNDEQGRLGNTWGIRSTPTIVIVKEGEITAITTGITTPPGLLARLWLP